MKEQIWIKAYQALLPHERTNPHKKKKIHVAEALGGYLTHGNLHQGILGEINPKKDLRRCNMSRTWSFG